MEEYVNQSQLEMFNDDVICLYKNKQSPLMQILQESQKLFGCVPLEVQKLISSELNISTAKINGVVSFYTMFSLVPSGRHIIGVCTGTACHVKGAQRLEDRVSEALDTPYGETTKDGQFTLQHTRCVGDCAKGAIVMVNDKMHSAVTSDNILDILEPHRKTN